MRAGVVVLMLMSLSAACQGLRCIGGTVDGCSIPYHVPFIKTFTPACNKHDVCYACGVMDRKSRKWCDEKFRLNMLLLCEEIAQEQKLNCMEWAEIYYATVFVFGADGYKKVPEKWCHAPWVGGCVLL